MECRLVARSAAAAVALDSALAKPGLLGGPYGRLDLRIHTLAYASGYAYEVALEACTRGSRLETLGGALWVLASAPAWLLSAALGALVTLALASWLVGAASATPEPYRRYLEMLGRDLEAAEAFYRLYSMVAPSHGPRVSYAGLPPLEEGRVDKPLLKILEVAGESSIAYRDALEGFPRARSFSSLDPAAALLETLRVYREYSCIALRRGCRVPRGLRDAWMAALEGCSVGDVADLAIAAAFFSLLARSGVRV